MSDWRANLDRRLADAGIPPTRRIDILEEVQAFIQDRFEELRAAGHDPDIARQLALADLETDTFARELTHIEARAAADPPPFGSRRSTFMTTLWQDFRYAGRSIRTTPGFSLVVTLTLALGIGANAAIFSVADAVMLRPYAYPEMDRIVVLSERTTAGQPMSVAWPTYQDWVAQNQVFEHLGVYRGAIVNITGGDRAERLNASVTSSGVFGAVGIQPFAGRTFGAADDGPGASRTALISERLWRARFNSDPNLIGRTILLNNEAHTVVGIMPPAMRFPSRLTDVWLPLGPVVTTLPAARGAHPGLYAVGKLKPGVTFETAVADMGTIAQRLASQYPESNRN
nr:ABC transporter permease [Acidobacteriota bacterium]